MRTFLVLGSIAVSSLPAHASLGGRVDSIESDRRALSAVTRQATPRPGFTVHELEQDGTTIREYVSPSGVVFGIAWAGVTHPDLGPLLGSFAEEYKRGVSRHARSRGRRSLELRTDRLVVQKWGHARKLQGRAFVPSLLPPGVAADEIQ